MWQPAVCVQVVVDASQLCWGGRHLGIQTQKHVCQGDSGCASQGGNSVDHVLTDGDECVPAEERLRRGERCLESALLRAAAAAEGAYKCPQIGILFVVCHHIILERSPIGLFRPLQLGNQPIRWGLHPLVSYSICGCSRFKICRGMRGIYTRGIGYRPIPPIPRAPLCSCSCIQGVLWYHLCGRAAMKGVCLLDRVPIDWSQWAASSLRLSHPDICSHLPLTKLS